MQSFLRYVFAPKDIWSAAKRGDVKAIRQLAGDGADVNAKRSTLSTSGFTPLHYAVSGEHVEAIRELVRCGAKIDAREDQGGTPLLHAVSHHTRTEVIDTLLELGADINRADKLGNTPLEAAASLGFGDLVRHLLERGAKPSGPGQASIFGPLCSAVSSGKIEILTLLMKAGSRVDPEPGRDSALGAAALKGRLDMVQLLLEAGANPNHRGSGTHTPLMDAVRGRNLEVVRALIEAGADVNAESEDGLNVLDRAIQQKDQPIASLLRNAGAVPKRFGDQKPR